MSKTQRIALLVFATGLLVLLLLVVPLNAYHNNGRRAHTMDKWGTIWDKPRYAHAYDAGIQGFYRPDKERMLLSIGSWIVVCGVAFVLVSKTRS